MAASPILRPRPEHKRVPVDGVTTLNVGRTIVQVVPRAETVEVWIRDGASGAALLVLDVDGCRDFEAAVARALAHVERNRRVIGEKEGVYRG